MIIVSVVSIVRDKEGRPITTTAAPVATHFVQLQDRDTGRTINRETSNRDKQCHFRHCLLFLYDKNNMISGNEAEDELARVYGEEAPRMSTCNKWLKRFRDGNKDLSDLGDEPRCGRPVELDDIALRTLVEQDPRTTVRELALLLNRSTETVHRHLYSIGKVNLSSFRSTSL